MKPIPKPVLTLLGEKEKIDVTLEALNEFMGAYKDFMTPEKDEGTLPEKVRFHISEEFGGIKGATAWKFALSIVKHQGDKEKTLEELKELFDKLKEDDKFKHLTDDEIIDKINKALLKGMESWKKHNKALIAELKRARAGVDGYVPNVAGILFIVSMFVIPFMIAIYISGYILAVLLIYVREKKKPKEERKSIGSMFYEAKLSWIYVLIHTIRYFRMRRRIRASANLSKK